MIHVSDNRRLFRLLLALSFLPVASLFGQTNGRTAEARAAAAPPAAAARPQADMEETSSNATLEAVAGGSATNRTGDLRDPFWPVGYAPPPVAGNPNDGVRASESSWRAAQKLLIIKGVSRVRGTGGLSEYTALINGRLVQTGETVNVTMDGKTFQWRVVGINLQDGPLLQRIGTPATGKKDDR